MIDYSPFWNILEHSDENWYTLSKEHQISASILYRMKHNRDISMSTVDRLCRIFHCQPGDLMTYIFSENDQTL